MSEVEDPEERERKNNRRVFAAVFCSVTAVTLAAALMLVNTALYERGQHLGKGGGICVLRTVIEYIALCYNLQGHMTILT